MKEIGLWGGGEADVHPWGPLGSAIELASFHVKFKINQYNCNMYFILLFIIYIFSLYLQI